jgi:hypothetical protein
MQSRGESVTVKDTILHTANVVGAVHPGRPREKELAERVPGPHRSHSNGERRITSACRNFALRKTVIRPGWDHTASMGYRRPPQRRHPRRTEAKFFLYAPLRRHGTQSRRGPPSRAALNDVSLEAQGTPSGPSATRGWQGSTRPGRSRVLVASGRGVVIRAEGEWRRDTQELGRDSSYEKCGRSQTGHEA